jgi:hypothetical protein
MSCSASSESGGAEDAILAKLTGMLSNVAPHLLGHIIANTLNKTLKILSRFQRSKRSLRRYV